MAGVFANTFAVIIGSIVGIFFRKFISDDLGKRIEMALGYCTLILGLRMAMKSENVLVLVGCIGVGGFIGWRLNLEQNIEKGARKLQSYLFKEKEGRFATGLTTSWIIYCVGGMTIVGAINSGVAGNHEIYFTKSILDGVISAPLAGIYGIGVTFAAIPLFLYQGALVLLASKAQFLNQPHLLSEMSGVGGVLVTMIGINLTRISKAPAGDFLPAMLLVILWAFIV